MLYVNKIKTKKKVEGRVDVKIMLMWLETMG